MMKKLFLIFNLLALLSCKLMSQGTRADGLDFISGFTKDMYVWIYDPNASPQSKRFSILQLDQRYQPLGDNLIGISGVSANGFYTRIGTQSAAARTLLGTADRLSILNGDGIAGNPVFDIDPNYPGQLSINTLGTVTTGTWNAAIIADAYIDKSGDWIGTFDGQEGSYYLDRSNHTGPLPTALGTVTTGTWNAAIIADAYIDKSGDWIGTFDGQEGSYYLDRSNHTGPLPAGQGLTEISGNLDLGGTFANVALTGSPGSSFSVSQATFTVNGTTLDVAGGTAGQVLTNNGLGTASWKTPDVTAFGSQVNNQLAVWTGDGTLEGDSDLTWDGERLNVSGQFPAMEIFGTSRFARLTVGASHPDGISLIRLTNDNPLHRVDLAMYGTTAIGNIMGIPRAGKAAFIAQNMGLIIGTFHNYSTYFGTNNTLAGEITSNGSWVIGSPTGGARGPGTINAVALYDDGIFLNDYVFEIEFIGQAIDQEHQGWKRSTLEDEVDHVKKHYHLSTMPGRKEWESRGGKIPHGELISNLWETVEVQMLYIGELNEKIKALESQQSTKPKN